MLPLVQGMAGEAIKETQNFLGWLMENWPLGVWLVAVIAVIRFALVPLVAAWRSGKGG